MAVEKCKLEIPTGKLFDQLNENDLDGFEALHQFLKQASFPALSTKEDEMAMETILWEERAAFSIDPDDIGCV